MSAITSANRAGGLYDPSFEHDACGVGFVANLKGVKSHPIIRQGLEILENLNHRGACGCEADTGDGAGLLSQIPDKFFRRILEAREIELPAPGQYGVGMVFLPPTLESRNKCEEIVDRIVVREGLRVLAWREVPVNHGANLGPSARAVQPAIAQVFIAPRDEEMEQDALERKLYVIRKCVTPAVRGSAIRDRDFFYWVSLSTRTLIYKGQLMATQVRPFYPDLAEPDFESAIALVHSRYSTNTFPSWELAHPYRYLAHNGEINTLRGNMNWMIAREHLFESELFGADIKKLTPIIMEGASDSAAFDNVLELLVMTGRSLPHAVMMMIPEAWEHHESMSAEKKAFYEYHASIMEPWDGPASIAFTDGRIVGAVLDRNGLRPSRYWVTKDDRVIMASESGVLAVPAEQIVSKGRLQPGRMFLVDTEEGRIIPDEELKSSIARRKPYGKWLGDNLKRLSELPSAPRGELPEPYEREEFTRQLQAFGYTQEDLKILIAPMVTEAYEAIGSMGNDAPLAVLSDRSQLLYQYFKQLFAQVTNPPLDAIREELVTSMRSTLGRERGLFNETSEHCRMLALDQPILTDEDLARIRSFSAPGFKSVTLQALFPAGSGEEGLRKAMDELCEQASAAVKDGATVLVLSDRGVDHYYAPIPALLACAGVHHHLIREGLRTLCGLVVESGEPREVHHFALLLGYGAGAVNPYLALQVCADLVKRGDPQIFGKVSGADQAVENYVHAAEHGVLKVMSKMGISTLMSYRGAQIFEAIGLNLELVHQYFTWTPSRIQGVGLDMIAEEASARHQRGYPPRQVPAALTLDLGGQYQWLRDGEQHQVNPEMVAKLQRAVRVEDFEEGRKHFAEFSKHINDQNRKLLTLRGLLEFKRGAKPIPLEEVEPSSEIVKRFCSGAMSFGSISAEAHQTLAIAMNRIGGKSNTGEGGEDPARFIPDPVTGDSRKSAIKQVASGRFGVTSEYLMSAEELQIKMAQGAKPGEGGQLPGQKVYEWIARVRHSTPGVGLISPPPHHDIYSIEDLAQLIYDLKNSNRAARIAVKLVAEVGVGTVAAGVAKGHADVVLISGHDGGTGASPLTSIKHAGLPWELGLAETHQVLMRNGLRSRIIVQTDGMLRTGRDVAIACLLGAEEFGFATTPLIALGCIMMRKCHMDTCPVGVATQNPELRKKFAGTPQHAVNFFFFVAEELREIMASLGFRTINEMVGRSDRLVPRKGVKHPKARGLNLAQILEPAQNPKKTTFFRSEAQDHGLATSLDETVLLEVCRPAIEKGQKVRHEMPIRNIHRTVGTIVGSEVTRARGAAGLPEDTIELKFAGSAGQSFAAFTPKGMTFTIEGDANDYFGKGLSGAKVVIFPPHKAKFVPEENIIIGNVAFYGATSGEAYIRGQAGERFCVRNSGVHAVVEGVGDHGCEYMTGGRVVVLGKTGRNFAAGMSGGIAYVYDEEGSFKGRCNAQMVDLEAPEAEDLALVRQMIERHKDLTGSRVAERLLKKWSEASARFVKVMPKDFKRVLSERKAAEAAANGAAKPAASMAGAK